MNDKKAKRVGLVGHCRPDSSHLTMVVTGAVPGTEVIRVLDDAGVDKLLAEGVDLLLVNRKMEAGYADEIGTDYIVRLKKAHSNIKMMLISNLPDAQKEAVKVGALPGFGKDHLMHDSTKQLLRDALK